MRKEDRYDIINTARLPHIGIDMEDIPKLSPKEVMNNEVACTMLLNSFRTSSSAYDSAKTRIDELEKEVRNLEKTSSDRKSAVIIMAVAQVITSIGVGGMFTNHSFMAWIMLAAGVLLTGLSLYLNFGNSKIKDDGQKKA